MEVRRLPVDKGHRDLKLHRLGLLKERERRVRSHALDYFRPNNPKQWAFFRNGDKFCRGIFAGNRFGKTTCGVVEFWCWVIGHRPFFDVGDPARTLGIPRRGVKILTVGESWSKLAEVFTGGEDEDGSVVEGKVWTFKPPDVEVVVRRVNGYVSNIICSCECDGVVRRSTWRFYPVDSFRGSEVRAEGGDYDVIHIDEPVQRPLWNALSRGLMDNCGKAIWAMTSLKHPWMFQMATGGTDGAEGRGPDGAYNGDDYWYCMGETSENTSLSKEAQERYFDGLDDAERDARSMGSPLSFGNRVYKAFEPDTHVIDGVPDGWVSPLEPPKDWMLAVSIDVHNQKPHAVLFAAVSPAGRVHFYFEMWERCGYVELSAQIKDVLKREASYIIVDPLAWIPDPSTRKVGADIFFEEGLYVNKSVKAKAAGIILAKDMWKRPVGEVTVAEGCNLFISELKTYYYDRDEHPVDQDDHFCECFYRLVYRGLHYIEPPDIAMKFSPGEAVPRSGDVVNAVSLGLPEVSFKV